MNQRTCGCAFIGNEQVLDCGHHTFTGRHSQDNPDWYTPAPIVEAARATMGGIDCDPATDLTVNERIKATTIYTVETNGLDPLHVWYGTIFLNPPGGQVNDFWTKLVNEWVLGHVTQALWVGYSLEQLQTLQQAGALYTPLDFPICITAKRIGFEENEAKRLARIKKLTEYNEAAAAMGGKLRRISEKADSPSHSNYLTYLGTHVDRFIEHVRAFGQIKVT